METLLVIEDSKAMQRVICRLFKSESFQVEMAHDGTAGLQAFRSLQPSVVVLDLKLPGVPGRELCRQFKSLEPTVPVIVLSANSEVEEKVLMLEIGADDYVTKPFSNKELVARVRRALRRAKAAPPERNGSVSPTAFCFGNVAVDFPSMEVIRAGQPVMLTVQEFRVLKYFSERPGRVITREALLSEVWGYQSYPSTRTVDNHIFQLRQKLEPDPSNPQHFVTIVGAGYKFVPAPLTTAG